MILRKNYEKRRARGGKGLIPPNNTQWENEHNALDLRDSLGVSTSDVLIHEDAFDLLKNVKIFPHGAIPMAQKFIEHFRRAGKSFWSGIGIPFPDGGTLVIYNDSHSLVRIRATLMEEFFHLYLGHPASVIRPYYERATNRDYKKHIESEAYCSAAAALLPYQSLKSMLEKGKSVDEIAKHFKISHDLVIFRSKVTKLYKKYFSRRSISVGN